MKNDMQKMIKLVVVAVVIAVVVVAVVIVAVVAAVRGIICMQLRSILEAETEVTMLLTPRAMLG
jgi:hypothetical protein